VQCKQHNRRKRRMRYGRRGVKTKGRLYGKRVVERGGDDNGDDRGGMTWYDEG